MAIETTDLTAAQIAAIEVLFSAGSDFDRWFRANGQTGIRVATGDALVRMGLAQSTSFMRAARGYDSAYRLSTNGRFMARRLRAAGLFQG